MYAIDQLRLIRSLQCMYVFLYVFYWVFIWQSQPLILFVWMFLQSLEEFVQSVTIASMNKIWSSSAEISSLVN